MNEEQPRKWKSITGFQGQWKAEVEWDDGSKEVLTCVHQLLCKGSGSGFRYEDPNDWIGKNVAARSKFAEQVQMIKSERRVIVTTDSINENVPYGDGYYTRTGYVGVFDVADIKSNSNGRLAFRFTKRYAKAR